MTAAHASTPCCRDCSAAVEHAAHHDRLRLVDTDPEALLELIEMAVTWHELDYSGCDVVGPHAWATFAAAHSWTDPDRAERAFRLALDIVGRPIADTPARPTTARVIELVRH